MVLKYIKYQFRWAIPLWLVFLLTNWLPENRVTLRLRGFLAGFFIGKCGKNFLLGSNVTLLNTDNLEIGDNVYIAKGTWINSMGNLVIEDEVIIAPYVVISTLQHNFKNNSVRFGGSTAAPVKIGKGTWLAAHSSIKCGVTVGKGNLIAANTCVVKNTPDKVIVGGVPGKVIKENHDTQADFFNRNEYSKCD